MFLYRRFYTLDYGTRIIKELASSDPWGFIQELKGYFTTWDVWYFMQLHCKVEDYQLVNFISHTESPRQRRPHSDYGCQVAGLLGVYPWRNTPWGLNIFGPNCTVSPDYRTRSVSLTKGIQESVTFEWIGKMWIEAVTWFTPPGARS